MIYKPTHVDELMHFKQNKTKDRKFVEVKVQVDQDVLKTNKQNYVCRIFQSLKGLNQSSSQITRSKICIRQSSPLKAKLSVDDEMIS